MKEDINELVRAFQWMYPRIFASYEGDPIEVIKKHGKDFLGDQEQHVWSREVMGGERGIHLSDDEDSLRS